MAMGAPLGIELAERLMPSRVCSGHADDVSSLML
jgi:hypothetical protein